MTLYEKSLKTLELPALLEMLAAEAVSDGAKAAAAALFPVGDREEVRRRLAETTAAKNMMALRGSPAFSGIRDVRGALRRADMGGMLNTAELLDIAALLRAAAQALSYGSGDGADGTALAHLFAALRSNKYLEGRISTSIVGIDEIADSASTELSDIWRHMRAAGDRIRQVLNKIISSPTYSKALQEPIITVKNDRYVVPVKAEHRSAVPGLVHEISASGATFFIEPTAVVQQGNELRALMAREKREIERILMELSAEAAAHGDDIASDYVLLTALDLIFAKAKLSYRYNGCEPELSEDRRLSLRRARHPLLDPKTAVPIDIRLGGAYDTLVITGPNTGGKTVSLKTLGLLPAMAYCGLHLPADDGSVLPVYGRILADIGDEQSIEQSLSTFSSHMTNIVGILGEEGDGALLLFDELGAGTDPVEGAALAIAIIEHARKSGAHIAATTHYSELKGYAVTAEGVVNASCEFDVETLRPTYRLLIGVPGKSNAFAISTRLGLPEAVVSDAKRRVTTESAAFEEVLEQLERSRLEQEKERLETRRLLRQAQEDMKKAEEARRDAERTREGAARAARREAGDILAAARQQADAAVRELRNLSTADRDWKKINEARSELFRRLNEAEAALGPAGGAALPDEMGAAPPDRPPEPGDQVLLISLGTTADVVSVAPDGTLSLQAGIMKITARQDEVRLIPRQQQPEVKRHAAAASAELRALEARPELDIRGFMTDEAIPVLERFLDTARLGGLHTVTVIHGKGTGALRRAVHASLRGDKRVRAFRLGHYGEGEAGVTIVELR